MVSPLDASRCLCIMDLVEKIEVKFANSLIKTNAEIANEVLTALKSNWSVPNNKITIQVEDGWITLEGELPWNYQKEAAKTAINYLSGVIGVTNNITIKSTSLDVIEKKMLKMQLAEACQLTVVLLMFPYLIKPLL